MPTIKKHPSDRASGVTWTAVTGVQPVVYVVRRDDQPFAIVEYLPTRSFSVTLCSGHSLGAFDSLRECREAIDARLAGVGLVSAAGPRSALG